MKKDGAWLPVQVPAAPLCMGILEGEAAHVAPRRRRPLLTGHGGGKLAQEHLGSACRWRCTAVTAALEWLTVVGDGIKGAVGARALSVKPRRFRECASRSEAWAGFLHQPKMSGISIGAARGLAGEAVICCRRRGTVGAVQGLIRSWGISSDEPSTREGAPGFQWSNA